PFAPEVHHPAFPGDDALDHRPADILEVEVVDSRAPLGDRAQRIAAADHQVTGVEAETDVGATQHFRDLVRSFNVTGAVVVEGRLVPTLPADAGGALHALGEPGPAGGVEHQRGIVVRPAGRPAARL